MKVLLIFYMLLLVAMSEKIPTQLSEAWKNLIAPYRAECVNTTHVDPVLLDRALEYAELPDEASLKCTLSCIAIKLQVLDTAGNINVEKWKQVEGITDAIVEKCSGRVAGDVNLCQKAYHMSRCVTESVVRSFSYKP